MKRTTAFCALLAVLALCLTLACACTPPEDAGYTVTANYDDAKGTVEISKASAANGLYALDESVTVTVTPGSQYEVTAFTVSGHSDAALSASGTYVFKVTGNTEINVTFTQKPATKYQITLQPDAHSAITLSPQAADNKYEAGTSVTATVTTTGGYQVSRFYAGSQLKELTAEGTYTFPVEGNITLAVLTVLPLQESVLESLQGALSLKGTLVYTESSTLNYEQDVIFTQDAYYNKQLLKNDNSVEVLTAFKNAEGKPVSYYLRRDNTLGETPLTKYADDLYTEIPAAWDDFVNPFDSFTVDDFAASNREGEYVVTGDKASLAVYLITRYNETVQDFIVHVTNGAVDSIQFTTIDNYDGVTQCQFAVTARGNDVAAVEKPALKPTTANHEKLSAALSELATADFTLEHKAVEGTEEIVFNAYYGPNAYYYTREDVSITPCGAVVLDGEIYEFTYDDGVLTKGDKVRGATNIKAYNPHCNVNVALFEDKGNGLFVAYDEMLQADRGTIAQVAGAALDPLSDRPNYALTLRIQLTPDMLHVATIQYTYDIINIEGTMTLTYSNIGNTAVPVDFSSLEGGSQPSGGTTHTGKFTVDAVAYNPFEIKTVEITDSEIIINGGDPIKYEFSLSPTETEMLTFTYQDVKFTADWYDDYSGGGYWSIMSSDYATIISAKPVSEAPEGPTHTGKFTATALMDGYNPLNITEVEITETTIAINGGDPIKFEYEKTANGDKLSFTYEGAVFTADWWDDADSGYWLIQSGYTTMVKASPAPEAVEGPEHTGKFVVTSENSLNIKDIEITATSIIINGGEPIAFEYAKNANGETLTFTYNGTKLTADWFSTMWFIADSGYSVMIYASPAE